MGVLRNLRRGPARVPAAAALLVTFASASLAGGVAAAKTQSVTDKAQLQLVSADGNTLVESGRASGTLPGSVHVSLTLGRGVATSQFTIYASGGTIVGRGQGKLKPGQGGWESFGGAVTIERGTGRFKRASGKGELLGSIERVSDAVRVQVSGRLAY